MNDVISEKQDFKKIDNMALVVIDMQNMITCVEYSPHTSKEIIRNTGKLGHEFAAKGGFVVLARVAHIDSKDRPKFNMSLKVHPKGMPADPDKIVPELADIETTYSVTKRQMSAFFGTDLDYQLRCRGIDTVVLCGVSTGFGVETTAKDAFQLGYHVIFIEDAISASTEGEHESICEYVFPKIGEVINCEEITRRL